MHQGDTFTRLYLLTTATCWMTQVNVEYNLLDPLLRSTINPDGDVNDATGALLCCYAAVYPNRS